MRRPSAPEVLLSVGFILGAVFGVAVTRAVLLPPSRWLPRSVVEEVPLAEVDPFVAAAAFEVACERQLVDCTTLQAPFNFYADLEALNFWAVYLDPYVLVMDITLAERLVSLETADKGAFSILVHEMAHHVDYVTGALKLGELESICQSEARAWQVSNGWLVSVGAGELATWNWWTRYPQCGFVVLINL